MRLSAKYWKIIVYAIVIIHAIIFSAAIYCNVQQMIVYNLFSIIMYLVCVWLIDKELLSLVYIFVYVEIAVHSYIASVCLGWSYGFQMYMIALVPVGFYMSYFMGEKKMGRAPFILAILDFLVFISCRYISEINGPLYRFEYPYYENVAYVFNAICTFGMLLSLSAIFLAEMNAGNKELTEMNRQLNMMAKIDSLTGLFNRRGIQPYLDKWAESGRVFCVGMCDIDNFKKINDTYGHESGDEVIKHVASVIRAGIKADDHVCRWGGEEFVFIVDYDDINRTYTIAENIRKEIEKAVVTVAGGDIRYTITIGVAEYEQGENVERTIARADDRLYSGKNRGKNVVVIE